MYEYDMPEQPLGYIVISSVTVGGSGEDDNVCLFSIPMLSLCIFKVAIKLLMAITKLSLNLSFKSLYP